MIGGSAGAGDHSDGYHKLSETRPRALLVGRALRVLQRHAMEVTFSPPTGRSPCPLPGGSKLGQVLAELFDLAARLVRDSDEFGVFLLQDRHCTSLSPLPHGPLEVMYSGLRTSGYEEHPGAFERNHACPHL